MTLTLYTEEYISAAHLLTGYQGKCSQMHGHTWKICVWIRGDEKDKDSIGIIWDFNKLKNIVKHLDHKYLNDIIKQNPSVENISLYIYKNCKKESPNLLFKIRVYESIIKKESYCETGDF